MVCSWNLIGKYFLEKMLISDAILPDPCIFHKSGIISDDISRNWKLEKSLVFYLSYLTCKKIFISRYDMIIFVYKSWSVNSGWVTLFVGLKSYVRGFFSFQGVANYV